MMSFLRSYRASRAWLWAWRLGLFFTVGAVLFGLAKEALSGDLGGGKWLIITAVIGAFHLLLWHAAGILAWQTSLLPAGLARLGAVIYGVVFLGFILMYGADIADDLDAGDGFADLLFFLFALAWLSLAVTAAVAFAYVLAIRLTRWVADGFRLDKKPAPTHRDDAK